MIDNKELEIVKHLLESKGFPEEANSFDYSKLALLGSNQIKQFRRIAENEKVSSFELISYIKFVESVFGGLLDLGIGKTGAIVKVFDNSLADPELEFGRICIPLLSDIYANSALSRDLITGLDYKLIGYICSVFRFLPQAELERLVRGSILSCIKMQKDIVKDFRWMYYVSSPEYDGGAWGRQFLPLIKKNQELLGEKITVGEKELAPTIENWLLEYDAFTGKPGPQREAFDRLRFVQNNQNAKVLSKENTGVLLKLCELYDWFSDPYVTEAEVGEFEDIAPATARKGMRNEEVSASTIQAGEPESGVALNTGSSILESSSAQVQALNDKTDTGYRFEESARVQGRLPEKENNKEDVATDTGVNIKKPNMDSGLPSPSAGGFVETGMIKPSKQVQKSGFTPHGPLLIPTYKALPAEPEEKLLRAPTLADIKAEAVEKKQKVQADIDRKLAKLKIQESRSKNKV